MSARTDLLLAVADDELILGWRNSEWTGIAPFLEEDVAFSSIAQGEIGHARALYELVAGVQGGVAVGQTTGQRDDVGDGELDDRAGVGVRRVEHRRADLGRGGEVDLADIAVPFNNIIGDNDWIVPPAASTPLTGLVGTGDNTETHLRAGHVGLVVGRSAHRHNIPAMASWIESHLEEQ